MFVCLCWILFYLYFSFPWNFRRGQWGGHSFSPTTHELLMMFWFFYISMKIPFHDKSWKIFLFSFLSFPPFVLHGNIAVVSVFSWRTIVFIFVALNFFPNTSDKWWWCWWWLLMPLKRNRTGIVTSTSLLTNGTRKGQRSVYQVKKNKLEDEIEMDKDSVSNSFFVVMMINLQKLPVIELNK